MANLDEIRGAAYEKRLQNFMAKYGQNAQEGIKEITTTAVDGFRPATTLSGFSHYGPTPTAPSAVWDSAASPTAHGHTEGLMARIIAWILGHDWEPLFYQLVVPSVTAVVIFSAGKMALDGFTRDQWEVGIKRFRHGLDWPRRQFDRLVLWTWDNTLAVVRRFYDRDYIQYWHAHRVVLWQRDKCTWITVSLLLWIAIMFYREWSTPGCWVKIHDLQHRGLRVPDWAYEASRKQHGHRVEMVKNEWDLLESMVPSTLYHGDPTTTTFSATGTAATQTIEVRGPTEGPPQQMVYEAKLHDEPCTETVTIRETTTDTADATPREERTVTIHETPPQPPEATPQAERPNTSHLPHPSTGSETTTTITITITETATAPSIPSSQRAAADQDHAPFTSYIFTSPLPLPITITKWQILANVTPTTVQTVKTSTVWLTRAVTRTAAVPGGGTLVSSSSSSSSGIPTTAAATVADMRVLAGRTGAVGVGDGYREEGEEEEEEEAHVCVEDVGKGLGYCNQCQQYHCCELRS